MKKRIGSKLYDTDTAELVSDSPFGKLYRKRTRDREWFFLPNGGSIQPLTDLEAMAMLGEPSEYSPGKPEPQEYRIRIDRNTYDRIAAAAEEKDISMAAIFRSLAAKFL